MPPKAARGTAARGRPRGRAGGKAAGESSAAHARDVDRETQPDIVDTEMPDADPIITPPRLGDNDMADYDPNSYPASQPTETPAPTPRRAPQTQSQSQTEQPTATGVGTESRGRGKVSRFKPRNIRRDQEELKAVEAKEEAKRNALMSAAARARGKIRGGRGRGSAMGRGGVGRGMPTVGSASGLFSVLPASDRKPGVAGGAYAQVRQSGLSYGIGGTGGGGGSGGGSGAKIEGSQSAYTGSGVRGTYDARTERFIPEPQYPDEDEDSPRVDIEKINNLSDEEDDLIYTGSRSINKGKGKAYTKNTGLKPIRLSRKEHQKRVITINTEPVVKISSDDEEETDMVADEKLSSHRNPQDDQKEWKGVYDDDTDKVANIISEPGLSPPQTFKNPLTTIQSPSELPPASQPSEIPKEQKVRRHSHSKRKDKKPIIQTEEDRAEYARHLHDMAVLRHELGGLQTNTDEGSEQPQNVEGDAETEEPVQENTHGRLYLFQFPPVLPKLYNPLTSTNPNITAKPSDKKSSIDLTKSTTSETSKNPNSKVKAEPEAIIIKKEDDLEASNEHEKEKFVNEEGYIGKLIVRESGKVELSWGGTNMVMGRGASAGFLSAGVVVDGMGLWGDDRGNSNANGEGKAMAMGEIMGKFVVVPNWERLA